MKKLLAMAMALMMILSTAGMAMAEDKARPESPVVVGVTCPYSGFVANLGENLVRGIELALEVEGRADDIKLIIEDTELTSELAVTKCESLLKKDNAGDLRVGGDAGHHLDQFAADKRTNAAHIGFSLDQLAGLPSWLALFYQSVSEKATEI